MSFAKDFTAPLSCPQFTGYSSGSSPSGTVLHCVTHNPIKCKPEAGKKLSITLTVVAVPKEGWAYSHWKKPKGNAKSGRLAESQPLFEVSKRFNGGGSSVIQSVKMFQFFREGKFDKGARDPENTCEIAVGMTLRFHIHDFMFEDRKERSLMPQDVDVISEFSMVELVIVPAAVSTDSPGFGFKLQTLRPLDHTLYSYMGATGLPLLPGSYEDGVSLSRALLDQGACISRMIENVSVGFYARASTYAFIVNVSKGLYRLTADTKGPAIPSVMEVDILESDVARFTNSDTQVGCGLFLIDLAAAMGALNLFVVRNPYFVREGENRLEYRAVPLIDTTQLLSFIEPDTEAGEDSTLQFDLPVEMESLEKPFAVVSANSQRVNGAEPSCVDLPLRSDAVCGERAYAITVGDDNKESIMSFVYNAAPRAGMKRMGGYARIAYKDLKEMRI